MSVFTARGSHCSSTNRKELWERNRFANVAVGEDTRFVWSPRVGTPLVLADHRFFVGIIHPANTSPKVTRGSYWRPRPVSEVETLLGDDWAFYAGAGA